MLLMLIALITQDVVFGYSTKIRNENKSNIDNRHQHRHASDKQVYSALVSDNLHIPKKAAK
jgi:hypothetical protein